MRHDTHQFISDAALQGLFAAGMHLVVGSRTDAGLGARTNGAAARRGLSGDRWDGTGCWRAPGASPAIDAEAQRAWAKISAKKPGFDSVNISSRKKGDVRWKLVAVRKRKLPC
jgi:hypothetical protein